MISGPGPGDKGCPGITEGASAGFKALSDPFLSVVIPTYRRPDSLGRVLGELARQIPALNEPVETVVCDDASGDGTRDLLRGSEAQDRIPLAWISLAQNGGPARARNLALQRARGSVILLLGDDIVPGAGLLARHAAWHREHPDERSALLGRTTWPEDIEITPLMRYLERSGRIWFMNYRDLPAGQVLSGMVFYTCNVSFKRSLFRRAGAFDERFPFAAHEDLELGIRMEREGMRLAYDPAALGYHWHILDFGGTVRRLYRTGYSAVLFWQRVGERGSRGRRLGRKGLAGLFGTRPVRTIWRTMTERLQHRPWAWGVLLHGVYWSGFADALRGRMDMDLMEYPRRMLSRDTGRPRTAAQGPAGTTGSSSPV